MRRSLRTTFIAFLLLGHISAPNGFAAVQKDPYLPIIKSLTVDYRISVNQTTSNKSYALFADIAMAVRVHANSLSGFSLALKPIPSTKASTGCQAVTPANGSGTFRLDTGKVSGVISESTLPVLKNFVGSKPDGEWNLQGYEFQLLLRDDLKLPPCVTDFKVDYIYLIDEAIHEKSIVFGYGTGPIYEMITQPVDIQSKKLLPENSCPSSNVKEFPSTLYACAESANISSIQTGFTQSEIDAALKLATGNSLNPSSTVLQMAARVAEIGDRISFLEKSISSSSDSVKMYVLKIADYKRSLALATDEATKTKWLNLIQDQTNIVDKLDSAIVNAKKEISELTAERQKLLASIATATSSAKPSSNVKKFGTIQCQKGKEIKKFMGYNPVCPKGYTLIK